MQTDSASTKSPWTRWLEDFERMRARPLPGLSQAHGLDAERARLLGRSLARFRVGETGEGRIAHEVRRFSSPAIDGEYCEALALFVAEEGRHARILGQAVRLLGERNISETWSASLFTRGRRLLGVRTKLLVLLTAELVTLSVYSAFASRLPDGELREALREIRDDEERHMAFHSDFFSAVLESAWARRVLLWALTLVCMLAHLTVQVDHGATLRAFSISPWKLWRATRLGIDQVRTQLSPPTAPKKRLRRIVLVSFVGLCSLALLLPPWRGAHASEALREELTQRLVRVWTQPKLRHPAVAQLAVQNPEWRLLHALFSGLSFANLALRDRAHARRYLGLLERATDEMRAYEREHGHRGFLLPYGAHGSFVVGPQRSAFVDGEIAMLLGARQLVARDLTARGVRGIAPRPEYTRELVERSESVLARMGKSPVACAESYPDECWMFCTVVGLVSLRMADALTGSDHHAAFERFSRIARDKLTDPRTGLLVSSYQLDGTVRDGPEGSTLWMAVHCLALLDPELAREQYALGKHALGMSFMGHAAAREWPVDAEGPLDIDVGLELPVVEAAAASSGFAVVAASTFHDTTRLAELIASIDFFAAFLSDEDRLLLEPGYELGSAVVAYGLVQGPLWDLLRRDPTERESCQDGGRCRAHSSR